MSDFGNLEKAKVAALQPSQFDGDKVVVKGLEIDAGKGLPISVDELAASMMATGFQATNLGLAIEEVNKMLSWRLSDDPVKETDTDERLDPEFRKNKRCTVFLSFTSNMISCGVREVIKFLVQHKMVDCITTTAGGVEEDFIKCLAPTYVGDFKLKGTELRKKGVNRLGNLLVPNDNYCQFEDWIMPILIKMTQELNEDPVNVRWSPSKIVARLGKEIDNEESVFYWAQKNGIPVFCPAITDGSIGDMIYFHSYKYPEFYVDLVQDIRGINDIAVRAECTGMLIIGGGLVKHHTCNANLMRNGANFAVFINTGQEFDGSDSGASPDEAVSWGKININTKGVKVCADASLVFPLLVTQTFLPELKRRMAAGEK
jgi:deoxyhypusine synthase